MNTINLLFCILISWLLTSGSAAFAAGEVATPVGYSVQQLDEVGGSILKPDGWSFGVSEKKNAVVYAIAEEDLFANPHYETGFRIQYIMLDKSKNSRATEFARKLCEASKKNGRVYDLSLSSIDTWEKLTYHSEESFATEHGDSVFHVFYEILADNNLGMVVYIDFRCRTEKWTEKRKYADVIFGKMTIIDPNKSTLRPNKALVPTATSVTPAADAPVEPAAAAAHL